MTNKKQDRRCKDCDLRESEHSNSNHPHIPRPRGFAAMDRDKVREIARVGGLTAHANGTAHRFTREEAIINGRKGGLASRRNKASTPLDENRDVDASPLDSLTSQGPE